MKNIFYQVAVNTPFNRSILTYSASQPYDIGTLVEVPLGSRKVMGCILNQADERPSADFEIKNIANLLSDEVIISPEDLELYKWMSKYYHYSLGQLIFETMPKLLKRPREYTSLNGEGKELPFELSADQARIEVELSKRLGRGFSKSFVHGVTGSGKTAIYIHLVKKILNAGQSVLFLLPEINLTPQFLQTFKEFIDAPIYSYHSSVTNSEKFNLLKLLQSDTSPKMIVGVRSSVFLPVKSLGLIIVDEEHDNSFKQEDRCPYNARDVAVKKASIHKIPVVLGSATPAVETFGQYFKTENYFSLKERISLGNLPDIEYVDLRGLSQKENYPLTEKSIEQIQNALSKKEQVLVFVNRLGFSNYLQCSSCGHQFVCPNCTTNLRFFKRKKSLSCHYCEYSDVVPEICPSCQNMNLLRVGYGTEKLQELLKKLFPDKTIKRFDRDEIKTQKDLERRLKEFHSGEVDILVGTQMLSKGHNFRKVNLVLILGVDSQLNFPDFRSNEKVYQLITQVSGRSGRFGKKSKVLIHTMNPDNNLFTYIKNHSFDLFYSDELPLRKLCMCPPYTKIIMVYFTSKSHGNVIKESTRVAEHLRQIAEKHFPSVEVLGPRPSIVEKKVNKFTWSLMVRSTDINDLHNLINTFLDNTKLHHSIHLKIDVDPLQIS